MIDEKEKIAVSALFPFMGKDPVVIDVGSNKGHWSDIIFEEFNGNCQVHLIEPIQKLLSFTEVKYEYRRNVYYHKFLAYKTDEPKIDFHFFENFNNELSSIYDGRESWDGLPQQTMKLPAKTIDTFCKEEKIQFVNFLKIDCEGSDMDVFIGCKDLLANDRIGVIQIEYSEHWERSGYDFVTIISLCSLNGYKIYRYEHGNFIEEKNETPAYDNYFLTKYEIRNYSEGWNKEFVVNTLELPKPALVLEIGNFEGINTRYICEKLLADKQGARVICIDPMEDYYISDDTEHPYFRNQYQRFLRNTRGLQIELKKGRSEQELPKLNALRFDLIYVDGDHREDAVYFDACWSFAICKEHCIIIFDDYEWKDETKRGIDRFLNEFAPSLQIITKGYQVVIKKIHNQYNELTNEYYK